jgi:polyisoprenoid-binding protein YceI
MTAADSFGGVRGWVEAPVKTLTTANDRRDRDLAKSMEPDKYPNLRFDLKSVTVKSGTPDSAAVGLQGTMTIHGVSREVRLPATVRRTAGDVHLRSDFPLNLKDYKIGGLTKALGLLKMDEHITVHVDVTFAPK